MTEFSWKKAFDQCKYLWCSRIINFVADTFKILIKRIIFQPLHVIPGNIWIEQPSGYILRLINRLFILIKSLYIPWQSLIFLFIAMITLVYQNIKFCKYLRCIFFNKIGSALKFKLVFLIFITGEYQYGYRCREMV